MVRILYLIFMMLSDILLKEIALHFAISIMAHLRTSVLFNLKIAETGSFGIQKI